VAKSHESPDWRNGIIVLTGTIVAIAVVLALYWLRPVLIPLAGAIILTLLLAPGVRQLQRTGMNRIWAVLLTVAMVGIVILGIGWTMTQQFSSMIAELPKQTATIKGKIRSLREMGSGPTAQRFDRMIDEITEEFASSENADATGPTTGSPATPFPEWTTDRSSTEENAQPQKATTADNGIPWLALTGYLGSAFEVMGSVAFSLILLVFFLLEREELRDRLALLSGRARLTVSSKALQDITQRISRYLVMVAMVNGSFGLLLSIGLFLVGMPYALLWGFFAGMCRFVPYIGPWVGALFPITMSLALSEGWWQPLVVVGYVIVLELVFNNIVEPLLFGRTIGVSPAALLISAAFWLYLWGPIGLVLSAPFAVCLVVIGKNIPQLRFLHVLLSDQPALGTDLSFYQRLLLGESAQATKIALAKLQEQDREQVYDETLIPTLNYARRDLRRGQLSQEEYRLVLEGFRQTLADLDERVKAERERYVEEQLLEAEGDNHARPHSRRLLILGDATADDADHMALTVFQRLLDPHRWQMEIMSEDALTSEVAARVAADPPAVVCIAALPPGGLGPARYSCKRIRAAAPDVLIIVGRWGQQRSLPMEKEYLREGGANFVTTTLRDTRKILDSQFPIIEHQNAAEAAAVI